MVFGNSTVCSRHIIYYFRQLVLLLAFRLTWSMKRTLCYGFPQNNNVNIPTLALFGDDTFHKIDTKFMNVFTVQSLESGYVHTYRSVLQLHYYYYYYYHHHHHHHHHYHYVAICGTNISNCVC
jgi:hypothetical protein